MQSRLTKIIAATVVGITLVGSVGEAAARPGRYYPHGRGIGPGAAVAGAALGIAGLAVAGVAANRYYNGYPAYGYAPGYRGYGAYGYDYIPQHGYYGPY